MENKMWRLFPFLFLLFGLVGCAEPSDEPPTPTLTVAETILPHTPEPTNTPSPQPTQTATAVPPTQTPTPTPTTAAAACPVYPPLPADRANLPDLTSLEWELLPGVEGMVRQLTNSTFPLIPIGLTQNGRWLAVAFRGDESQAAIALLDTEGNDHRWITADTYFDLAVDASLDTWQRWLARDQLAWLAETGGQQVMVQAGETVRSVEAPIPLYGIDYATNNIAFAQGESGSLWRADLAANEWEEVTTDEPPVVGFLGGFYGLAGDGSYALSFQGGQHGAQLWRIPAEMGAETQPLPQVETPLDILGSGAPTPRPHQLADSSYWLINLPLVLEGSSMANIDEVIMAGGVIVDTSAGRLLTAEDLGLPADYYLTRFDLSPDGQWLAIELTDGQSRQSAGLYLAPADGLANGRFLVDSNLSVAGWQAEPPAVIFHDETADSLSVAALPLRDDSAGMVLNGAGQLLATLPGSLITTASNGPAELLQFDLDGTLLNRLDLLSEYELVLHGLGENGRFYLGAVGQNRRANNDCRFELVEWTPESES
jgi:hypothetical protein